MRFFAYPSAAFPGLVYPSQVPERLFPRAGQDGRDYSVGYRFQLLDRFEKNAVEALSVLPTGYVKWHSTKSIKGGGTITVRDTGQKIDWPNARIKPWRQHVFQNGDVEEFPLGVYLMSAPVEEWDSLGRKWRVELLDKNSILDSDIVTDENGDPVTFSVVAGKNLTDVVISLIAMTGEPTPAITSEFTPLSKDMSWAVGTPILKIINDLLAAGNHFSLMCDMHGQYRIHPYVRPSERPVIYDRGTHFGPETPFSYGESSLMSPEWSRDLDIYAVPNRWVSITQGDSENEALVATATNEDPISPFSYQARGRWITQVETAVEAVDEAALLAHAERKLDNATSSTVGIQASHLFLPYLHINSVVRFKNKLADNLDMFASVLNTTVPFDPLELCESEFREFSGSHSTWSELEEEE